MGNIWFLQAAAFAVALGMIAGGAMSVVGWIVVACLLFPTIAVAAATAGFDLATALLLGTGLILAFNTGLLAGVSAKYATLRAAA